MQDAFGVERGRVSKGLPSALKGVKKPSDARSMYAMSRIAAHQEGKWARFHSPGMKNRKYLIERGKRYRAKSRDDMYPYMDRTWNKLRPPADRSPFDPKLP